MLILLILLILLYLFLLQYQFNCPCWHIVIIEAVIHEDESGVIVRLLCRECTEAVSEVDQAFQVLEPFLLRHKRHVVLFRVLLGIRARGSVDGELRADVELPVLMLVTLVTLVKLLQPSNAMKPTLLTPSEITRSVSRSPFRKRLCTLNKGLQYYSSVNSSNGSNSA